MRRVIVIRRMLQQIKVPRLYNTQAWQLPSPRVILECREEMELGNVLQPPQIPVEQSSGYVLEVDTKVQSIFLERVEDGLLWIAQK